MKQHLSFGKSFLVAILLLCGTANSLWAAKHNVSTGTESVTAINTVNGHGNKAFSFSGSANNSVIKNLIVKAGYEEGILVSADAHVDISNVMVSGSSTNNFPNFGKAARTLGEKKPHSTPSCRA